MQVDAKYIRYNPDMTIKEIEVSSIDIEPEDRVLFVDNSYLDYCLTNKAPNRHNRYPAGTMGQHTAIRGTVLRTDAVQEAWDSGMVIGPRRIEMPIVVLGDDGSVTYCNAMHIQKI